MTWSDERLGRAPVGIACTLLSAVALWHATGLHPAWWLTWLAPVPVLAFALRSRASAAAAAAFAAWAGGALDMWSYYRTLRLPLPVALLAVASPAVVFALATLLARVLVGRGRLVLATLALPSLWTAAEHLSARSSPHGTFGSLAYSQMDCVPVLQVASVCGAAGITYLLLLVPTALAVLTLPARRSARRRVAAVAGAAAALALGFGFLRLANAQSGSLLRVGLAAADTPQQPADPASAAGQDLVARYGAARASLTAAGADVVILPETTLRVAADEMPGLVARLGASGTSVLVAGLALQDATGERNVAVAAGSGRPEPAVYAKQHLLLPPESRYRPGRELRTVAVGAATAGLAVCKDLDFPSLGRGYARQGAALLLVPAWDFDVDGWLHSRMAVLRGVEGGFAVARAARRGRLTLSDERGRVLADAPSGGRETQTLLGAVRLGSPGTPYSRLGDWFGWSCCGLALVAIAAVRPRRAAPAPIGG